MRTENNIKATNEVCEACEKKSLQITYFIEEEMTKFFNDKKREDLPFEKKSKYPDYYKRCNKCNRILTIKK